MDITFFPSKAKGSITAPPSKSVAHRVLISAGLAKGKSTVKNLELSNDILATIDCLRKLGTIINIKNNIAEIVGTDIFNLPDKLVLNCRESASTLRFLIPICMLSGKTVIFKGSKSLLLRPIDEYVNLFGDKIYLDNDKIIVKGSIKSGKYLLQGSISSQFISGLLFALPLLKQDSMIETKNRSVSYPYIDMTIDTIKKFGVNIFIENENIFKIPGCQSYRNTDIEIEGDYSNSAFLEAFNLFGGKVFVSGLDKNTCQGDKLYRYFFQSLSDKNCEIDISDCPDLAPVLFSVATINGATFYKTNRLKIKESNRCLAMKTELSKLGVTMVIDNDRVKVLPAKLTKPLELLYSHNDHRVAMALSVLLSVTSGTLKNAEVVNKSFPSFFDKLENLGVKIIRN